VIKRACQKLRHLVIAFNMQYCALVHNLNLRIVFKAEIADTSVGGKSVNFERWMSGLVKELFPGSRLKPCRDDVSVDAEKNKRP